MEEDWDGAGECERCSSDSYVGMRKCSKLIARVIRVVEDDCGEVRVVVLVDVYLPIGLWSGWQFPKFGTIAAALFRHLR